MATILVVDDHPDLREVLVRMLEMHGHSVHACESGEEALRSLHDREAATDVMVVDDRMGGMTGLEVLRLVRQEARFNGLFVVVWSADPACQPKALAGGADEFWMKGSEGMLESIDRLAETLHARRNHDHDPSPPVA